MSKEWVAVFDVDGVFTDGCFYNTSAGKYIKKFGPDDWDAVKLLNKHIDVQIISADKKGWPITEQRFSTMGLPLTRVSNHPTERWDWIKGNFPNHSIIYVGDGLFDWYSLQRADFSACPADALPHVRDSATYTSCRRGSERFVAEVCIQIMRNVLELDMSRPGLG